MKILHILAGDLWGGREAQLEVQLSALRDKGSDARAMLFNDGIVAERYRRLGIPVAVVEERHGIRSLLDGVREAVAAEQADLLVSHGYKETLAAAYAARKTKIPFIVQFHGAAEPFPGFAGLKMKAYEQLTRVIARLSAARIVCVSHALTRSLGFESNPRLRVIYNSITGIERDNSSKLFPKPNTIVMIGRLVRVKRIDLALKALNFLEPGTATLAVVGNGAEDTELKHLAAALRVIDRVEFLGFREDALRHLHEARLLLITSDSEGIPTVLLDAIQLGVPVVSTAVGGIPEVLEHFPDYPAQLARAGDEQSIADALRRALADSRTASPDRIRTLEALFSGTTAARMHLEMYAELSKGAG